MNVESPDIVSLLTLLSEGMRRLESQVSALRERPAVPQAPRTFYSVAELAKLVGKAPFTVRQWCNMGQINAVKRIEKRGGSALWGIAAEELERYRNDGLLPMDPQRNNRN